MRLLAATASPAPRWPCARARAPCRCSCSAWPSAPARSSTPPGPLRLRSRVPWRPILAAVVVLLAIANLPSLTGHRLVDPAIDRDEDPPAAWQRRRRRARRRRHGRSRPAAARPGVRRLPLGLHRRPAAARADRPSRSSPATCCRSAAPRRWTCCTRSTTASRPAPSTRPTIAPVARLLGADTIWLTGDAAFDRFRTPRPELVADLFAGGVPGTGPATTYGDAVVNVPDIPMVDEQSLSDPRVGQPVAPVELVPVTDAVPVVRAKDDVVLVAGSGDGLVDAAGAGLHRRLASWSATPGRSTGDALADAAATASQIIVTDSNRDRAHHWRSSQDVAGFTEDGDPTTPDLLRRRPRRPAAAGVRRRRRPRRRSPCRRARSSPGPAPTASRSPTAPRTAPRWPIDGDPTTAWRVADRSDPIGEQLQLDVVRADRPPHAHPARGRGRGAPHRRRHDRRPGPARRSASSSTTDSLAGGQRIDIEPTTGPATITITIDSVVVPDPTLGPALAAVGFAEVDAGLGADGRGRRAAERRRARRRPQPTARRCRTCSPGCAPARPTAGAPIPSRRWCAASTWRPTRSFTPEITVRLDQRATDATLAGAARHHRAAGRSPAHRRGDGGRLGARPTATRRRRGRRRSAAQSVRA